MEEWNYGGQQTFRCKFPQAGVAMCHLQLGVSPCELRSAIAAGLVAGLHKLRSTEIPSLSKEI